MLGPRLFFNPLLEFIIAPMPGQCDDAGDVVAVQLPHFSFDFGEVLFSAFAYHGDFAFLGNFPPPPEYARDWKEVGAGN